MKRLSNIIPFVTSVLLFMVGIVTLIWWGSSDNSWRLRIQLQTISPLFLEIVFMLILVAIIINSKNFKRVFSGIPRRGWILLGTIVIAGLFLIMAVVPREHRIFYDEDIYQNIGQNIAFLKKAGMCNEGVNEYGEYRCNRLEYNKQPNGWPYLLSVTFRLVGVHEQASFITNNLIYALSIITTFLIGYLLFGSYLTGIYTALIFALIPEGLMWSNSVTVEPSAILFSGLAILSTLIFINTNDIKSLFLTLVILAFAIQIRSESILTLAMPALIILLFSKNELKKGRFYLLVSIFFLLLIPHLIHLYAVKGESWGATGPKLSTHYFEDNFKSNTLFYLKNIRFPLIFTILFGIGILFNQGGEGWKKHNKKREKLRGYRYALSQWLGKQSYHWKEKVVILIWFLLFWGIFVLFYAGGYNFGVDVRYSLLSHMPLALMAGYGAGSLEHLLGKRLRLPWINYILFSLIIFSFISFLPLIRAIGLEAWAARADHRFAQIMAKEVPPDSIILTHNPNMFLLWGKSAAQTSLATEYKRHFKRFSYRYKGGIYFHYGFWCNVDDPHQRSLCKNILKKFNCDLLMSFKEKNFIYELYQLKKKIRD